MLLLWYGDFYDFLKTFYSNLITTFALVLRINARKKEKSGIKKPWKKTFWIYVEKTFWIHVEDQRWKCHKKINKIGICQNKMQH